MSLKVSMVCDALDGQLQLKLVRQGFGHAEMDAQGNIKPRSTHAMFLRLFRKSGVPLGAETGLRHQKPCSNQAAASDEAPPA